jgi:hypothetical protein
LELAVATQQASSGAGQAPKFAALQQQAHAPELGALQGLVATSKLRSLELACLFKQNKQK